MTLFEVKTMKFSTNIINVWIWKWYIYLSLSEIMHEKKVKDFITINRLAYWYTSFLELYDV